MTSPSHSILNRLDLDQLLEHARSALDQRNYDRAILLFREASRRAPMRQDIRACLGSALDGNSNQETAERSETVRVEGKKGKYFQGPGRGFRGAEIPFRTFTHGGQGDAGQIDPGLSKPVDEMDRVQNQDIYTRRHERGPASAAVLGVVTGLMIIGMISFGVWNTVRLSGAAERDQADEGMSSSEIELIKEDAHHYRSRGEYAWAIEHYEKLPDGTGKKRLLAETYMEQGDRTLRLNPPDYKSTVKSYRKAVQSGDRNPEYGNALGAVYLTLTRDTMHDQAVHREYLELARDTFLAVLEIEPANIETLVHASRIGRDLGDRSLQVEMYRALIQRAPGTEEASQAKKNLRSMGFMD
jgi:tetratricopeptide (TPR) repeat protein